MNFIHAAAETESNGGLFNWWGNGVFTFVVLSLALYVVTRFNQDR